MTMTYITGITMTYYITSMYNSWPVGESNPVTYCVAFWLEKDTYNEMLLRINRYSKK